MFDRQLVLSTNTRSRSRRNISVKFGSIPLIHLENKIESFTIQVIVITLELKRMHYCARHPESDRFARKHFRQKYICFNG
jgi:hypothetical protein